MPQTQERPGSATGANLNLNHHQNQDEHPVPAECNPSDRRFCADPLRRRRAASRRLEVLDSGLADPWTDTGSLTAAPANLDARRKTWLHLRDLCLVDGEGWITSMLADAGGATW